MKNTTISLISVLVMILFSCSEMTKEFQLMSELDNEISEKYETNKVEINLKNKNTLIITLKDSKFNNYSPGKKKIISKEIGILVKKIWKNTEPIKSGLVKFVNEKKFAFVKTSTSDVYNMYEENVN